MWHASVSLQTKKGAIVTAELDCLAYAVQALDGVGGDVEWWLWSPAHIGHLRVPVTIAEGGEIPPGLVAADAGDSGPLRARTVWLDSMALPRPLR